MRGKLGGDKAVGDEVLCTGSQRTRGCDRNAARPHLEPREVLDWATGRY